MAQHSGPDRANAQRDPRHTPRLAALLGLATSTGTVAALLTLRVLTLADELPTARFQTYLELPLVGVGGLLAAWVAINAVLAGACVLLRAAGLRWTAGERIVRRHAPALVRRLASTSVAVSVGAGLVLGAGSAQAAEVEPAVPAPAPAVVDLGWQSTPPEQAVPPEASLSAAGPARVPTGAAEESTASALPLPDDARAPRAADTGTGTDIPTVAPRSATPVPDSDAGQPDVPTPTTDARPDHGGPASTPPDGASSSELTAPGHIPLSGLLGGSQPAASAPHSGTPLAVAPPGAARPEGPETAVPPTGAGADASTVSVVVLRGDSLWSLAERALDEGATDAQVTAEWQRWYAANTEVIGQDPDLIRPGQVLRAPRTP